MVAMSLTATIADAIILQANMKSKSIILIGMAGIGKSTIGTSLSKTLGLNFIDLDDYILEKDGLESPTSRSLTKSGKSLLRRCETTLCLTYLIDLGLLLKLYYRPLQNV